MTVGQASLWFVNMDEAERLEDTAKTIREKALRAQGWTPTSDTPGSYWMWYKEIKGVKYMVSYDMALHLTSGEAHLELITEPEE